MQAPKLPAQKESKLARLSAFLADGKAGAGVMMHAVSVTSWLTEAEPEAQTPGGYGGPDFKVSLRKKNVTEKESRVCADGGKGKRRPARWGTREREAVCHV